MAPQTAAILCSPRDAPAFGMAAAQVLARRHGAPAAVICMWTADEPARGKGAPPATRAARRLADALAARGHEAQARGRAVTVWLPAAAGEAATAARRVLAATAAAPAVLVVAAARDAAFDALLLADVDTVLVVAGAGASADMLALAVADLRAAGAPAQPCELSVAPAVRAVVAAGMAVPPSLRRALAAALGART